MSQPIQIVLQSAPIPGTWQAFVKGGLYDGMLGLGKSPTAALHRIGTAIKNSQKPAPVECPGFAPDNDACTHCSHCNRTLADHPAPEPRYTPEDQKVVDLLAAGSELLEHLGRGNAEQMLQANLDFLGIKPTTIKAVNGPLVEAVSSGFGNEAPEVHEWMEEPLKPAETTHMRREKGVWKARMHPAPKLALAPTSYHVVHTGLADAEGIASAYRLAMGIPTEGTVQVLSPEGNVHTFGPRQ